MELFFWNCYKNSSLKAIEKANQEPSFQLQKFFEKLLQTAKLFYFIGYLIYWAVFIFTDQNTILYSLYEFTRIFNLYLKHFKMFSNRTFKKQQEKRKVAFQASPSATNQNDYFGFQPRQVLWQFS